jgi:glutamine synthetase
MAERNWPGVTLDELRDAVAEGAIDTVLLGFADMQGRFQGKRLVADHFLEEVVSTERRRVTTCWPWTST